MKSTLSAHHAVRRRTRFRLLSVFFIILLFFAVRSAIDSSWIRSKQVASRSTKSHLLRMIITCVNISMLLKLMRKTAERKKYSNRKTATGKIIKNWSLSGSPFPASLSISYSYIYFRSSTRAFVRALLTKKASKNS